MLSVSGIILIIILAVVVWYWQDAMHAKELAVRTAKDACKKRDLQLLDSTTHLIKVSLQRNDHGKLKIARQYGFDYFDNQERQQGTCVVFDRRAVIVGLRPLAANNEPIVKPIPNNVIPFKRKED
jgi:hypothetical protein